MSTLQTLTDWCAHHAIRLAHSIHLAAPRHRLAVFLTPMSTPVHRQLPSLTIPAPLSSPQSSLFQGACSPSVLLPRTGIPFAPVGHPQSSPWPLRSMPRCEPHLYLPSAPRKLREQFLHSLMGPESKWHGYIQSLPPQVPIALFWGVGEACPADEDSVEARMWIAGTEVERELHDEVYAYYAAVVRPLLLEFSLPGSLTGYMHAYMLVSSRAFLVDAYHGLTMVPIADACVHPPSPSTVYTHVNTRNRFNHANTNHVHLASNYDVCPTCGSLDECPHNRNDIPADDPAPASAAAAPTADTCNMVAVRPIALGDEVFNTYGAQLGNATLLARYGFALEANEHNVVSWAPDGLDMELGGGAGVTAPWAVDATAGRQYAHVSVRLWLRVVLHTVSVGEDTAPELADRVVLAWFVGQVAEEQMCAERMIAARDNSVPEEAGDGDMVCLPMPRRTLTRVTYAIQALCAQCLARIGKHPEMSVLALGELLDGLPVDRPKTRLALAQVLAERAILESCVVAWQEVELIRNNIWESEQCYSMNT
ncbi:hypothetical protein B0H21DRAFT_839152 [Amylocystis lapponica]|nr:hypothetical protein B0H21DRAFT_839152 [Amylocystis lapponica]